MRLCLVAVFAAGCSFSGNEGNSEPTDIDAAPTVDAAVDAAIDAMIDPDRDDDGIDNDADNCPDVANPGQENEDLDTRGNVCDVCPHIVDDAQTDDDADGVGNACDPQPGVTNTWLYFEGFDAALVGDEWVGEGGFTVNGGQLHSVNNGNRYFLRNTTIDHGDDALLGALVSFDNPLGPNGVSFRYGGLLGRAGASDNNNGCWVLRSLADSLEGYAFVQSVNGGLSAPSFSGSTLPDVEFDIQMTIANNQYDCDIVPTGQGATSLSRTTNTNLGNNRVGVVSSYIETHVSYLYAITLQ